MELFCLIVLLSVLTGLIMALRKRKTGLRLSVFPAHYRELLLLHVSFYRRLDAAERVRFEEKMLGFLSTITIEGIRTPVEDIDRVLIAASAIIPIFAFDGWQYHNLTNILLYPDHFNEDFDMQVEERTLMGMVGTGYMNDKMILSKPALHEGFKNEESRNNTAIHEFVHLLDKMDGEIDGIPAILLQKEFTMPWINLMHHEINEINENRSDINPYGGVSKAEFFAVAAEYFFEKPSQLAANHPELFAMMKKIFDHHPQIEEAA